MDTFTFFLISFGVFFLSVLFIVFNMTAMVNDVGEAVNAFGFDDEKFVKRAKATFLRHAIGVVFALVSGFSTLISGVVMLLRFLK